MEQRVCQVGREEEEEGVVLCIYRLNLTELLFRMMDFVASIHLRKTVGQEALGPTLSQRPQLGRQGTSYAGPPAGYVEPRWRPCTAPCRGKSRPSRGSERLQTSLEHKGLAESQGLLLAVT